ncbi:MAG: TraB/GumN family protein, partial [Geopsychrobacter sp.]|nr:TraB/GumN family protein [Geopsychrobacter sp.]
TSLSRGYREFRHWAEQNITPETNQILIDDLLEKRNRAVLSYLPKALQKYQTLLIPWGALHMPGIEAAVKEQGFALQKTRERQAIDFLTLPYGKLWKNLTATTWTLSRSNLEDN